MKELLKSRRKFIKVLTALPVGIVIGCSPETQDYNAQVLMSPEDSIKKLIIILGPWPAEEKWKAENFANRFLSAPHNTSPYLPQSSELIQNLARRFPSESASLKEIDLSKLLQEEQQLLIQFVQQLYSYLEIRNIISKEPYFGECQVDNLFYTKPIV